VTTFVDAALAAIADGFDELRTGLADAESLRLLLENFGWNPGPMIDPARFAQVRQIFESEITLLNQLRQQHPDYAAIVPSIVKTLRGARSPLTTWPAPLNSPAFWTDSPSGRSFPKDLLDAVIWNMLEMRAPALFGLLRLSGVLRVQPRPDVPGTATSAPRIAYSQRVIQWNQFGQLIADPAGALAATYKWDTAGESFKATDFLEAAAALFTGLPAASAVLKASDGIYTHYYDAGLPTSPVELHQFSVIPLDLRTSATNAQADCRVSLNVVPIPPRGTRTGEPVGLSVFPLVTGTLGGALTVADGVTISIAGNYSAVPLLAEIRTSGVDLEFPLGALQTVDASARVDAVAKNAPWRLLGSSSGPRIEMSRMHMGISAYGTPAQPTFEAELSIDKAELVIDFGEGDGFLQRLLGGVAQRADVALALVWSNHGGFRLEGHGGLEMVIPVHQTLFGAVTVDTVKVGLKSQPEGFTLAAVMTASAVLGPITAAVKDVGLGLLFKPTDDSNGNLGVLDVELGFRPPDGAGLSLDAGAVIGAGYLERRAGGEYGGIVQLAFSDLAIIGQGLIKPSAKDFSMVIIVSVTFSPVIQLSWGFTLSGVGGLVAVNRTMNVEFLRDGLKTGALDALLFPEDPVANGPAILNTMGQAFPAKPGRFVVGPIVRIGWGTPNLIIADIGIMIELPQPIRLVLIGQIAALLPSPDDPVCELHIDVLGVLDFEQRSLSIDATLYRSKLLTYTLSGDAALRWLWGNNAQFALSLGGFHPRFTPPPKFPSLRRLTLNLIDRDNLQLDCKVYQAITSNTVQFGARAELYASCSVASIEGEVGFDALIQLSPFHFEVDIDGHVSAEAYHRTVASVKVHASLSGPTPWHINGKASFHVLRWDPSVHFERTWGREDDAHVPRIDPLPPFLEAVGRAEAWGAAFPETEWPVETLKPLPSENGPQDPLTMPVVIHPVADLQILQTVLPLDFGMECFGSGKLKEHDRVVISQVRLGGAGAARTEVYGQFALASYENLSQSRRLSSASFVDLVSGAGVAARVVAGAAAPAYEITYEQKITLADGSSPVETPPPGKHHPRDFQGIMKKIEGRRIKGLPPSVRVGTGDPRIKVTEPTFNLVDSRTLKPVGGVASPLSYAKAKAGMAAPVMAAPGVPAVTIPSFEVPR
jgi:hypothetical protein